MPGVIALVTLFSFLSLFHAVTSCRPLSSFVRAEIAELYHTSLGTVPSDLTNVDHIDTPAKDERDTRSEESGLTSLHMLSWWVEHTVRHRRFLIRRGALVQLAACRSMSVQFILLRTLHASLATIRHVSTLNVMLCRGKLRRCRVRRCDGARYRPAGRSCSGYCRHHCQVDSFVRMYDRMGTARGPHPRAAPEVSLLW